MANPQYRLDEEEKKIIDLIRQHKLDYYNIVHLLILGTRSHINRLESIINNQPTSLIDSRDLYKSTTMLNGLEIEFAKLLEYLEKGE